MVFCELERCYIENEGECMQTIMIVSRKSHSRYGVQELEKWNEVVAVEGFRKSVRQF